MDRLLSIGFQSVGHWVPRADSGMAYVLFVVAPHTHTLYAFVVDGDVKYVGKTTRTLLTRMEDYARGLKEPERGQRRGGVPGPGAPSTNARVGRKIQDALRQGSAVEIYVLPDLGLHHYGAFHLNLAAGLEDSIIATLDPEWNGGKKIRSDGTEAPVESSSMLPDPPQVATGAAPGPVIFVKMGRTYWEKGFFNIGIAGSGNIGADGQTIELYCGSSTAPILGSINRRANLNSTPRIFGGKRLREWIQNTLALEDEMRVEVLTPTAIRLSAPNDRLPITRQGAPK